jgi:hypothetical protein
MKQAHTRTPQPLPLIRRFEASRLEQDFLAAAYALVLPVLRRPLPTAPPTAQSKTTQICDKCDERPGGLRA